MSLKILHVGDVHPEPQSLDDCSKLIQFVLDTAYVTAPDLVLFEGDQHHNHAVMHLEVLAFWKNAFMAFKKAGLHVAALVGNHDMTGLEGSRAHAMMAYQGDVKVVDKPTVQDGILFLPYYSDPQAFVADCQEHKDCHTVVCHQTFQGSTYENGFYAKDGIDPNLIPQERIVSGHIHTPQAFGKVFYTGAPRWRILTDANVERAIWLMEYKDGHLLKQTAFSTGDCCKRIWHLTDTPETPANISNGKDQWRIDIKGPQDYVERRKKELAAPGVKIRTMPTQRSEMMQVRESEGVAVAFEKFTKRYQPKFGTAPEILAKMVSERLGERM